MNTRSLIIVGMVVFPLILAGCYKATGLGGDAPDGDAAADTVLDTAYDAVLDPGSDASCMRPVTPVFESLDYEETVQAYASFTLTIHHSLVLLVNAVYELDGSILRVRLSGTQCDCEICPDVEPTTVSFLTVEGLPPGEYAIEIQGHTFPLHVVEECERYLLTVAPPACQTCCPLETRVNQTAQIAFFGVGHSCDCGGYAETSSEFELSGSSLWGDLYITAEEVICDPSRCCDMCNCIDAYEPVLHVNFPREGFYNVYVNDGYLCFIAVFGEDGCLDLPPAYVEVGDYDDVVFVDNFGDRGTANFSLQLSTGMCCDGDPFIIEERSDDDSGNVTIWLYPGIELCEGDCCYDCECSDFYEITYPVEDLSPAVGYEVCVEGDGCYEVWVIYPIEP